VRWWMRPDQARPLKEQRRFLIRSLALPVLTRLIIREDRIRGETHLLQPIACLRNHLA
jgi:hypothetical protein